ncbi:hypothetical protein B0T11DRAFT_291352 [Plectosphaerella cucumerina]|uniref:C2H2-type domain-containing protein n=1 Tax=Plectosphaerella cucumerina TaxID=40658 RepID=A0A8K0TA61_9PEZI|nr:hypothetical protein B0T11DRAFT_291352 [Plectosphaerella cucumerina]
MAGSVKDSSQQPSDVAPLIPTMQQLKLRHEGLLHTTQSLTASSMPELDATNSSTFSLEESGDAPQEDDLETTNRGHDRLRVEFGTKVPPDLFEAPAPSLELQLRQINGDPGGGLRHDTVECLLMEGRWPYISTDGDAETCTRKTGRSMTRQGASTTRSAASFVWVATEKYLPPHGDDDVAAAGVWSDVLIPRRPDLCLSSSSISDIGSAEIQSPMDLDTRRESLPPQRTVAPRESIPSFGGNVDPDCFAISSIDTSSRSPSPWQRRNSPESEETLLRQFWELAQSWGNDIPTSYQGDLVSSDSARTGCSEEEEAVGDKAICLAGPANTASSIPARDLGTAATNSSSSNTTQDHKRKRVQQGNDGADRDGEESEDNAPGSKRPQHAKTTQPLEGLRFSCPYQSYDPVGSPFCGMKCGKNLEGGFPDLSRLKSHLFSNHDPFRRCSNCWKSFKPSEEVQARNHVNSASCAQRPSPAKYWMTEDQRDQVRAKVLTKDVENWFSLFSIVLPGVPADGPTGVHSYSPYFVTLRQGDPLCDGATRSPISFHPTPLPHTRGLSVGVDLAAPASFEQPNEDNRSPLQSYTYTNDPGNVNNLSSFDAALLNMDQFQGGDLDVHAVESPGMMDFLNDLQLPVPNNTVAQPNGVLDQLNQRLRNTNNQLRNQVDNLIVQRNGKNQLLGGFRSGIRSLEQLLQDVGDMPSVQSLGIGEDSSGSIVARLSAIVDSMDATMRQLDDLP